MEPKDTEYNSAIEIAVKKGGLAAAERWLQQAREAAGVEPDGISFNAALDVAAKKGDLVAAERWGQLAQEAGVRPEVSTLVAMMRVAVKKGDLEAAERWHQRTREVGVEPKEIDCNWVIGVAAKKCDLVAAERWRREMMEARAVRRRRLRDDDDNVHNSFESQELQERLEPTQLPTAAPPTPHAVYQTEVAPTHEDIAGMATKVQAWLVQLQNDNTSTARLQAELHEWLVEATLFNSRHMVTDGLAEVTDFTLLLQRVSRKYAKLAYEYQTFRDVMKSSPLKQCGRSAHASRRRC